MHGDPTARWAFTVLFAVLAVVTLVWLVGDRRRPVQAIGDLLHLTMTAAMIAMVWVEPGWGAVVAQLVLFGAGAIWFCVLAWLRATGRVRRRTVGDHGTWQLLGHAVMMAAMVWMLVAMGQHHADPATTLLGVVSTAALVVTGVLLIAELVACLRVARGLRRHAGDLAGGAAMSVGMAAMCWSMLG